MGAGVLWLIGRNKSVSGIGAAKRRIFKELSLAQKAGVDFEKKYDELSEEEIEALQQVSADTGYTETYYKSLKKAYDAISGIGTTYDVVNADGDTVLTWIDDPHINASYPIYADDADRYAALREAHDIDDDRQWEIESKQRAIEEKRQRTLDAEQRATEARKRLAKTRKAGAQSNLYRGGLDILSDGITMGERTDAQQSLFGIGYSADVERELYEIWREQIEYGDTDYDYDTWRAVAGDEYAKDVLRYM